MKQNPYVNINTFHQDCFNLSVPHIKIGLTKDQYHNKQSMSSVDIFQYLEPDLLSKLKIGTLYLVFDYSQEGIYQQTYDLFKCLDYNCKSYNIDKKQILYFTSNPFESSAFNINPIIYHPWIDWMQNHYFQKECDQAFEYAVNKSIENYNKQIYFSSFNKTWDRPWRDKFHYLLYKNNLLDKGFISNHAKPFKFKVDKNFKKLLPLEFDYEYFWSAGLGYEKDIFAFTTPQFHIVGESIHDIEHESFHSEKPLKPVAYFQPFFTYGAKDYNDRLLRRLKIKKFKSLENFYQNNNQDIDKQVIHLIPKIKKLISQLESINRIDWRFNEESVLKHNWLQIKNFNHNIKVFKKINKTLAK